MPGILAMSLMQLGLFATATPLVSLREEGVLRRLGATPLPRWQLISGQLLMRLTIGMAQAVLIVGISVAAFNVRVQGNFLALAGLTLLGALTFIGMGYLIAALARSVESAGGISSAINFPMMFLSGIFFPLAFLPAFPCARSARDAADLPGRRLPAGHDWWRADLPDVGRRRRARRLGRCLHGARRPLFRWE